MTSAFGFLLFNTSSTFSTLWSGVPFVNALVAIEKYFVQLIERPI